MSGWRAWLIAGAAGAGIAVTLALGFWQWGRAQQRLQQQAAIEARGQLPPLHADTLVSSASAPELLHRPVAVRGQWLPQHTVFLDNRQMNGRPGFYVVTPLQLEGRREAVLVQRGWAPRNFQQREQLPPVQTPAGVVEVRGRVAPPPARLYEFEGPEQGPIRQNLDLPRLAQATGLPLLPVSIQQAGEASEGLLRQWPQVASGADKNYGYAFQWWALSGVIAVLYAWFRILLPRRRAARA